METELPREDPGNKNELHSILHSWKLVCNTVFKLICSNCMSDVEKLTSGREVGIAMQGMRKERDRIQGAHPLTITFFGSCWVHLLESK